MSWLYIANPRKDNSLLARLHKPRELRDGGPRATRELWKWKWKVESGVAGRQAQADRSLSPGLTTIPMGKHPPAPTIVR